MFFVSCCLVYSLDCRKQVLKVKQTDKLTCQEVSDRFGLSIRALLRWQQRIIPKTKPNKPSTKLNLEAWHQDVEDNLDHFQYQGAKKCGVSRSAIYYALKWMHPPFFRGWRIRFFNRGQQEREDQDYHQTLALADEFLRKLKWID